MEKIKKLNAVVSNWSNYLRWNPKQVLYPSSEQEVQNIVIRALENNQKIRTIGTGHSFTPICQTDDILISLDKYQGLISVNKENCQATVKAGTKLKLLGELLFEQGLGMENLGDIDAQSIAGTISTGTHGTGKAFGTISTQVTGLKFINGKGEIVSCSPEVQPDLFKAAQVSLGLLGIILEVTLQCVPAYKLRLVNKNEKVEALLEGLYRRFEENRNFEFYWFPYTEKVWSKTSNLAEGEPDNISLLNHFSDYVLENYAYMVLCEIANSFPSKNQWVSKFSASSVAGFTKVYHSHKVYATKRLVKFNEMEYNIPIESHEKVFEEVRALVNSGKFNIHFPIENRIVKEDDIFMSPAFGRESAYIACHAYYKKDPLPYFNALEEIFRSYGGRPHWGKMHSLTTKDVEELYPQFRKFMQHRSEQDPDNVFVNSYFQKLFSI